MLKKVAAVAVLLILLVLGVAATKPDTFKVQRSTSIKAPPEKIYAFIEDFHRWSSWSPYEKLDPAMQRTFSGAERGTGAVYEWDGNAKAGKGRMEITDAPAPTKVRIKLDFLKPMEVSNVAEFTLEPQGDSTHVTWSMEGPTPYFAKVIHVFINMDRMVGSDFEAGLANLKALAES